MLARALFRRVQAAYHISFWLLAAGIAASLLKGLDFEEATLARAGAWRYWCSGGARSTARPPSSPSASRPVWVASIAGVIAMAHLGRGFLAYRHVELLATSCGGRSRSMRNAPRMLRASLAVVVLATAYVLLNMLRPARPEPGGRRRRGSGARARRSSQRSDLTLANAALTGDKRLLFSDAGDAFVMYQIAGRSWIALGDPVGAQAGAEELVWRLREMSDHHGGRTVFYQASAERLALYVDLGLAALKIGEEARVPLAGFSLEGAARADLRQAHRRAQRDGASFEVVPPERVAEAPAGICSASPTPGSRASRPARSASRWERSRRAYLRQLPARAGALRGRARGVCQPVDHRHPGGAVGGPHALRPRCAARRHGLPVHRADAVGTRAQGYRWFNLGMAPLAGLESHPLAPAWHRVGNFIFRHGEHFYNFDGLRRYKAKFDPTWEPRYLVARGGIALPRVLVDVSMLIAGGMKELFAR